MNQLSFATGPTPVEITDGTLRSMLDRMPPPLVGNKSTVFVGPDGLLRFVYQDELIELLRLGQHLIERASHVEPSPLGWTADLTPVGGPVLGPFARRDQAIAEEVNWLDSHMDGFSREVAKPTKE